MAETAANFRSDHRSPDEEKAKEATKQTFMDSRVDPSAQEVRDREHEDVRAATRTAIIIIREFSPNVTSQKFGAFDLSRN